MNLHTSIPPRKDGTVRVAGLNGVSYVFERDADGEELTAAVDHEPTAAHLLSSGMFYPASPADYTDALALTVPSPDNGGEGFGPDDEGNGLPVEAKTAPKPAAKTGHKPKAH